MCPRGVYERKKRITKKTEEASTEGKAPVTHRPKKRVYVGPEGVTVRYR